MRRSLAVLLVIAAAVLPGCGKGPGDGPCRTQYADYQQLLGENGNPGTSAMPRQTKRWDQLYREFGQRAKSAVSEDCTGDFTRLRKTMQSTESILYAAGDLDMVEKLRYAERDLKHAERMREYDPLPRKLAVAFPILRTAAPRSNHALARQFAGLDRADPLDAAAVRTATAELKRAASANVDYRRCRHELDVIADFELDEE
ncbi:MAG: hypothetical protein QOJ72_468 [Nocardioidaceae bacterium]|nr:hypothetical protein [Nocardioidaceae bacterium]